MTPDEVVALRALCNILRLIRESRPLPPEAQRVLYENLWELYL